MHTSLISVAWCDGSRAATMSLLCPAVSPGASVVAGPGCSIDAGIWLPHDIVDSWAGLHC
jgi:hypothetical protein